jgi:hypothetical protein
MDKLAAQTHSCGVRNLSQRQTESQTANSRLRQFRQSQLRVALHFLSYKFVKISRHSALIPQWPTA